MLVCRRTGPFVCRLVLAAVLAAVAGGTALADRPKMPELLPETTVAYLRVDDARELASQLKETAIGRMLRDPQVKPFVDHLYESMAEAFSDTQDALGLSFDEFLAIPQGEACLALVPSEQGPPALVALVDAGSQLETARKVMQYAQGNMEQQGDAKTLQTYLQTELTILQSVPEANQPDQPERPRPPARRSRQMVFFQRDQTIAIVSNLGVAKQVVSAWAGQNATTLAGRRQFAAIMEQCAGSGDERPQLTYFVDPIQLFKSATSGNMPLQIWLSLLRPLGLEGLEGLGGSLILNDERFERIHHMHLLLASSRTGVLEILSPRSGDVSPELWVPHDVATYMTVHWDFPKSYAAVADLYDFFRQDGGWKTDIETTVRDKFGADLKEDILLALDGRITRAAWIDPETNRRSRLLALKLKDAKAFQSTLDGIADRAPNQFIKQSVAGVDGYRFSSARGTEAEDRVTRRLPNSYVVVLGDYLLLSDRLEFLQRVADTKRGAARALGEELEFRLIASKVRRTAGDDQPVMLSFERPAERIRAAYETIRAPQTVERLAPLAQNSGLFQVVHEALSEHPLPPFSVLEKYFGFSGGLATSDDTGIHMVGFTYRRK